MRDTVQYSDTFTTGFSYHRIPAHRDPLDRPLYRWSVGCGPASMGSSTRGKMKQGAAKLSTNEEGEQLPSHGFAQHTIDFIWLAIYCGSGIALGMCFEILQLHAGPAKYQSFFLPLLGYWAQFLASGVWVLGTGTWRQGSWTKRNVAALIISAGFDGTAQALNFVAQVEGGMMLFTIFNSSVTLFACAVALLLPWTPRLRPQQWAGVCSIVLGLMLTSIPNPVVARHSFAIGLTCSMLGSFFVASSYPICEIVFRATAVPPSEEMVRHCLVCLCSNHCTYLVIPTQHCRLASAARSSTLSRLRFGRSSTRFLGGMKPLSSPSTNRAIRTRLRRSTNSISPAAVLVSNS